MPSNPKYILTANIGKNNLKINCYFDFIGLKKIKVKKDFFSDKCRLKCENFNKRYCCPPHAPDFNSYLKNYNSLLVLLITLDLDQLPARKCNGYQKLILGNSIIKTTTETIMRSMETILNENSLSLGECASCVSCPKEIGKPCPHPEKIRYSLGSFGIDCEALVKKLFGIPLLWYENGKTPKYTSGISALPLKRKFAGRKKITRALIEKLGAMS